MRCLQIKEPGPFFVEDASLISGSSLVYDSKLCSFYNNIPFDPNTEYLDDEIARTLYRRVDSKSGVIDFEFTVPPKFIADIHELSVPLCLLHSGNYFHFLIQSLATLAAIWTANMLPSDAIIVTAHLKKNMRSALESLLGDSFEIVELKRMNAVRCKKVLLAQSSFFANELISGIPPIGHYVPHNITILRELLLNKRKLNAPPPGDFSRIFIYRKSLWRRLVNIDEISDIARKLNYRVVCPEEYSFDEQLAIFNSASVVVGPTGAWMANLLFMNQDKQVKVLYPDTMRNSSFWSGFASILNLKLQNFYFTTDLPQNPVIKNFQPMHSDFYVPSDYFIKALETSP